MFKAVRGLDGVEAEAKVEGLGLRRTPYAMRVPGVMLYFSTQVKYGVL